MASVNRTYIIGNLGRDPELRSTAGGKSVARFSVACSESWTTNGEKQEHTEWYNVVVFGRSAEACGQYLSKGRQAYVEGRLRTRKYDDKDGNQRSITELIADNVQFLGGNRDNQAQGGGFADDGKGGFVDGDADVPF